MEGKHKKTQRIIQYYKEGHSQPETAIKFNCKPANISAILIRHKIKTRERKTRERYYSGKNHPSWKGGVIYNRERKMIYTPNHPNPNFLKKYCYEYRLKMEKKLGRYLKSNEIVHHKNGDVTDNRLCNLQVMTKSKHSSLHFKKTFNKDFLDNYKKLKRNKKGQFMKQNEKN